MRFQTKCLAVVAAVLTSTSALGHTQLRGLADLVPPYRFEEEWIVHQVIRGIVDASRLSTHAALTRPEDVRIQGTTAQIDSAKTDVTYHVLSPIRELPTEVRIVDHVWSSKTYLPIARALFPTASEPVGADDSEDLAELLTNPTIDHLVNASARVSARLAEQPTSASAHEQAAFVIGAMALKDVARELIDFRPSLNRMSVHLTIAEALQPSSTRLSREIATTIVFALAGRERDALRGIEHLEASSSPTVRAWGRALRLRVTGDWRLVDASTRLTPLEQIEYLRATRLRRGYGPFFDLYDQVAPLNGTWDQQRVTLVQYDDLESGQRFVDSRIERQLDEGRRLSELVRHKAISEETLVAALNEPLPPVGLAADRSTPQVLDWGLWAYFEQRHLCIAVTRWFDHVYGLGGREEAIEFRKAVSARLGGLHVYPIAAVLMARTAGEQADTIAAARSLLSQHPEVIPGHAWFMLRKKPSFANPTDVFPRDDAFYRPHVPTGTGFELRWRALQSPVERPVSVEETERLRNLAPYDEYASWHSMWPDNAPKPTMAQARAVMNDLLEYDVNAARAVYQYVPGTAADRLWVARILCTIDRNECSKVGEQLTMDGQESEAVTAYEYAIAHARDRVVVSTIVDWLVQYYEDNGNSERATALASDAADTYSYRGLHTFASLLNKRGDHDTAEKLVTIIKDKYGDAAPLAAHYLLMANAMHDPSYYARATALVPKAFPNGVETAKLSDFSAPPTDGMTFVDFGRRAQRTGLRQSDIVVAVDGLRVRSREQYWYVIRSSFDPHVKVIVWRDGRYQEVAATVPQRWFGANMTDYPPCNC